MKQKKYKSLIPRFLMSLTLVIWPQVIAHYAHANCIPSPPKNSETMNSTEPLIINESLLIEDIKKASKALTAQKNDLRATALQFGTIDTMAFNENVVIPFNSDIQSIFVFDDVIDFDFRPHSIISLSALQKAFGNYTRSAPITSRNGAVTTYGIVFRLELDGNTNRIVVRRNNSPDLTAEKFEVAQISIIK